MAVLCSCGEQSSEKEQEKLYFTSKLEQKHVVSGTPQSDASASATAVLEGNDLTVSGNFEQLSSQLRDLEEDEDNPGIHIHPGAKGQEQSYLYGLEAELSDDGLSGSFDQTFSLTDDEVALLLNNELYLDIHTTKFDPGELRDQLWADAPDAAQERLSQLPPADMNAIDQLLSTCIYP